jgi:FAD/FMN-containing dehydrogenase
LRGISDLHPTDHTITVETAVTVMELDEKLASMGAFVVHGECAHVAVGGHMQSGGFSPMFLRSFGYFCDHITKFRIVLAPRARGEDPRTVEVIKPIPGQTSAENDELWYVVLGGSPGNFGVVLDVTIKPLWDRDYPHSRGLAIFRMFNGEKGRRDLEAWIQLIAEYSDDDEMPADYNFNVIMLAGNPP